MKRIMKKFLAILLAAVMVMSMGSMGVMAEEVSATATTYTITVNSSLSGRTYVAYQLFTGDMEDGYLTNVVTGKGVNVFSDDEATTEDLTKITTLTNAMKESTEAISETKTGYSTLGALFSAQLPDSASAAAIVNVIATYGQGESGDDSVLVAFAKVVSSYLRSAGKISYTSTSNNGTTYNFSGLAAGYYLIVDETVSASTNEAYSRYMLVMTSDSNSNTVTIQSKEEVPTLTKTLSDGTDSASVTVGDEVSYKITTSIPDTTAYTTYTYKITDTLSKGLELKADSSGTAVAGLTALAITIKVGDRDALNGIRVSSADDTSSVSTYDYYYTTSNTDGTTTLTIVFTDFITLAASADDGDSIVTTYTAKVTSDAVIGSAGNNNTAYLTYSNNPNSTTDTTSDTTKDEVTVYTYEIDFTKVDSANNSNLLSGAKFYLEKEVDGTIYYAIATASSSTEGYAAAASNTTSGNTYKITSWTSDKDSATTLISGSDGVIKVTGLGVGTFYLEETEAPDGYIVWDESVKIEITATTDATSTQSLSATVDSKDASGVWSTGIITATITNSSSSTLPTTGGIGTTIFYILGSILALSAAVILVTRRRMAR